jgi:RIO kinase 1
MANAPPALSALVDLGVIDEVIRPLQAGKEAQVYLVVARGIECVAKVYKEASNRSFKHRSTYTEGRRVQNTRKQRAMSKGSRYGKEETEAAWRNAEVDTLYRLADVGIRVPKPYDFVDGVLIMELIRDGHGGPAPRLVDLSWSARDAESLLVHLVHETARMLCAGIIHGDLSDFNILVDPNGPVIIDFPQSIDPASNTQARQLLLRDVKNVSNFLGRFAPHLKQRRYGEEMWALYEKNQLTPETRLTGKFKRSSRDADLQSIVEEIQDVARENEERMEAIGGQSKYAARKARRVEAENEARAAEEARAEREKAKRELEKHDAEKRRASAPEGEDGDRPRRRRRRRNRNRGPRRGRGSGGGDKG